MRVRWRPPKLVGPLFGYDLIAATRRGQHAGLRILVAGLLLATLYGVYASHVRGFDLFDPFADVPRIPPNEMAALAASFATWCMVVQFGAVILLTPTIVADAVAREKERRALDFLFVTDLTDREIVLGKLGSRLAYLFGVLLTGLPILALTMFFGGVEPMLLFSSYAALIATLISLSALSLYCSVVSSTALQATVRAYAAAVGYLLICPCVLVPLVTSVAAVPGMVVYVIANLALSWVLILVSVHDLRPKAETLPPVPAIITVPMPPTRRLGRRAATAVAVAEILTIADDRDLPFVLALDDPGGHSPAGPPVLPADQGWDPADWRQMDRPVFWEPPELPRAPLPPVDERQPLLWKEVCLHSFAGTAAARPVVGVLLALAAAAALLMLLVVSLSPGSTGEVAEFSNGLVKVGTVVLGALLGIGGLAHAVNSVTRERERDTLDSLLTLPLRRDAVLEAKWLGGLVSLQALAIALVGVWLFGMVTGGLHPLGLLCLAASVAATVEFLVSLGLWLSIACSTSLRANMAAALSLLLVGCGPWVVSTYVELLSPRGMAWPLAEAAVGTAMPLVAWVRACVPWTRYAAVPEGYFVTLLVGALAYAAAAWVFWRAAVGRFRKYGGRRKP